MAYTPTKWEDSPSTRTPLNAENLNKLEGGVKQIHDMAESGQFDGAPGKPGGKGAKGDSVEYVNAESSRDESSGITSVTIKSKIEGKSEVLSSFEVKDGAPGKDGTAVISDDSVGYGLSAKGGKIELGEEREGLHIIDPPSGDSALIIGRVDGYEFYGIVKSPGYISFTEGGASVGIIGETDPQSSGVEGAKPLMDGKCRAHMMGHRVTILAENELVLAGGATGSRIVPGLSIPVDNKPRAFIDDYVSDASNAEYFIVNKKYLQSEIAKLVARIEALEAK